MAPSKRARVVSAAGREIEHALGLTDSTNVLARWMAYRLAEVREVVEHATDPTARKMAQAEQDSLIIALWAQRSFLPVAIGLDRQLGTAIPMIEALLGKQDQWHHAPPHPREPQDIVIAMRDTMQSVVTSAAMLRYKREMLSTGPDDPDLPLSKNERIARERLPQLASAIVRRVSPAATHLGDAPLSDEEIVALLEQYSSSEIDALIGLLNAFRKVLIERHASTNNRLTSTRKAVQRKAPRRRK
jgi:hypothetical protein